MGELQAIYREVLGAPTRSYNKPHLQKRIAYQLQVQAEGGLSKKARQRIAILQGEDVTAQAPFRWSGAEAPALRTSPRDPRLPPAGTVIRRRYRGIDHEITVLDDGFVYQGTRSPNLSRIATGWSVIWRSSIAPGSRRREVEQHVAQPVAERKTAGRHDRYSVLATPWVLP